VKKEQEVRGEKEATTIQTAVSRESQKQPTTPKTRVKKQERKVYFPMVEAANESDVRTNL
jgi:hypothetical protein